MTDPQMDEIRKAALVILAQIEKPEDRYQINRFLADLEPHFPYFIRIIDPEHFDTLMRSQ